MPDVNVLAVLLASLATFALGGLWYSPALFARLWAREAGLLAQYEAMRRGERVGKHPARTFAAAFVFSVAGALALALLLGRDAGVATGVRVGALAGLGVAGTAFGVNYQFAQKSPLLLAIDGGYHAIQFTLFGLVLGAMG